MKLPRFLLTVPILAAVTLLHAADPLTLAVLDFQGSDRALDKRGSETAALLGAYLGAESSVFLVERQELEKVLSEQELGLSGNVSAASAAKVGALVGAKVLVTGKLFESDGKVRIVAKVMGVETGRVFSEIAPATGSEGLENAAKALSARIGAIVQTHAADLVAKVETPEERLARLKLLLGGRTPRPVVVTINEQHLGTAAPDPAAQTELLRLFKDLGIQISDTKAAAPEGALILAGEAFSELGSRRGALVSCRSRVEITLKDASGRLLLADRANDVAVDIAEHVAGKRALENAALRLADRILPKLVE